MRWPFVTRKVHELEMELATADMARFEERAIEADAQVAYFRTRCERLTDAALARAGAIHEPTMVDRKIEKDVRQTVASALSMKEFDSTAGQ